MNDFPRLEAWLNWLINHSLQAILLMALVLAVQWLFRRWLTNRWRFALWWIVLARLLLPFSPPSAFSLFNYAQLSARVYGPQYPPFPAAPATPSAPIPAAAVPAPPIQENVAGLPDASKTIKVSEPPRPATATAAPVMGKHSWYMEDFFIPGMVGVWLAGVLFLTGVVMVQMRRFRRKLAGGTQPADPQLQSLLDDCQREFRVSRRIELLETDAVQSPALFGLFRLRLLLPRGLGGAFTPRELRYIFLHELAHVKRGDLWLNWLVTALQILHWFNPLLWFGFARLRADRELACDELALLRAGDHADAAYGETVVKLLERLSRPAALHFHQAGLVGILEDRRQMRRRILMIVNFRKPSRWSALALLLIAILAIVALTDAQTQPPKAAPVEKAAAAMPETREPDTRAATNSSTQTNQAGGDGISTNSIHHTLPPEKPIPGEEIKGIILSPDGQPAAGADVALQIEGKHLGLGKGVFTSMSRGEKWRTSTEMDGSFTLPMFEGTESVVALNEEGFAQVSLEHLKASPQITLQKWGRIEGTLSFGQRLGTNELISLSPPRSQRVVLRQVGETKVPTNNPPPLRLPVYDSRAFQTSTHDDGRFAFSYVPPGKQAINRMVPISTNSWSHEPLVIVNVKPGETVVTNVGSDGRTIRGRLKFNTKAPAHPETGQLVIMTSQKYPEKLFQLKTWEEREAYLMSAEVQTALDNNRSYTAHLNHNGSFSVEGVPPGDYRVGFSAEADFRPDSLPKIITVFKSKSELTVPPAKTPNDNSIVDCGTIEMINFP